MVTVDDQIFFDWEFSKLMDEYNKKVEANDPDAEYPDIRLDRSTSGTFGWVYNDTLLSWVPSPYLGHSKFTMRMPAEIVDDPKTSDDETKKMKEIILFSAGEKILFVFICELDLSKEN